MIYDKLENIKRYSFSCSALMEALTDLSRLTISSSNQLLEKSEEPYLDEKANLFLDECHTETSYSSYKKSLLQFTTLPLYEKKAEFHKRVIDIHVVIKGTEYVEIAHVDNLHITTPYEAESDIGFGYLPTSHIFSGQLQPGYFIICFPEDAHLVGAHIEREIEVKKLVYKIEADPT